MVVVNHLDGDVFNLHVHHPRHHTHNHDGKYHDEAQNERVATYLQELFLNEVLYGHDSLFLKFSNAAVWRTIAIPVSIATS